MAIELLVYGIIATYVVVIFFWWRNVGRRQRTEQRNQLLRATRRCAVCEYDVRANARVCPECGTLIGEGKRVELTPEHRAAVALNLVSMPFTPARIKCFSCGHVGRYNGMKCPKCGVCPTPHAK